MPSMLLALPLPMWMWVLELNGSSKIPAEIWPLWHHYLPSWIHQPIWGLHIPSSCRTLPSLKIWSAISYIRWQSLTFPVLPISFPTLSVNQCHTNFSPCRLIFFLQVSKHFQIFTFSSIQWCVIWTTLLILWDSATLGLTSNPNTCHLCSSIHVAKDFWRTSKFMWIAAIMMSLSLITGTPLAMPSSPQGSS